MELIALTKLIISRLGETALGTLSNEAYTLVSKSALKSNKRFLLNSKYSIDNVFNNHASSVASWSRSLHNLFGQRKKIISEVFIELEYKNQLSSSDFNRSSTSLNRNSSISRTDIFSIIESSQESNLVIYGAPGSGKTTTMKFIVNKLLTDENFMKGTSFPLVVRLRDLNRFNQDTTYPEFGIFKFLAGELGISLVDKFNENKTSNFQEYDDQVILTKYIDSLKTILLLDGFDELTNESKTVVEKELKTLLDHLSNTKILLTCRTGITIQILDSALNYEICPLDKKRIEDLTLKWFDGDFIIRNRFLREYNEVSLRRVIQTPLFLVFLCYLFEEDRSIKTEPKFIFNRLIDFLLGGWDKQRSFYRDFKYSSPEQLRRFLEHLSYRLLIDLDESVYEIKKLSSLYKEIENLYFPENNDAIKFFEEFEQHTGILYQSTHGNYEFFHNSFQEYLASKYIIREKELLKSLNFSKDSFVLSLVIDGGNNPSKFFSEVIRDFFIDKPFDNRLIGNLFEHFSTLGTTFPRSIDLGLGLLYLFTKAILQNPRLGKISSLDSFLNYFSIQESVQEVKNHLFYREDSSDYIFQYLQVYEVSLVLNLKNTGSNEEGRKKILERVKSLDFEYFSLLVNNSQVDLSKAHVFKRFPEFLLCKKRWIKRR